MQVSEDLKDFLTRRIRELSAEKAWSCEDGVLSIGTDPTEWTEGYEEIVAEARNVGEMVASSGWTFALKGDLQAYSEGTIGWAASKAKWQHKDGREVPVRVTGVFRREGDEWASVQTHHSIAIPNNEAFR
jgi:hypothetical protein